MSATLTLPDSMRDEIMSAAIRETANRLLEDALLTRDEASKLLNISTATLNRLPIRRIKIADATRYRRADLLAYVAANSER